MLKIFTIQRYSPWKSQLLRTWLVLQTQKWPKRLCDLCRHSQPQFPHLQDA